MEQKKLKCPVCKKFVTSKPGQQPFPFCSEYCQAVDLGRWINEEYRVPVDQSSTERDLPGDDFDA